MTLCALRFGKKKLLLAAVFTDTQNPNFRRNHLGSFSKYSKICLTMKKM